MNLSAPMRCSALAVELGEPMIGTVEQRTRWVLVEDPSAWGRDAVSDVLGTALAAELRARGVRALLVRRRGGDPAVDPARRAILVDTAAGRMAARTIRSVQELDPDSVASAPLDEFGTRLRRPTFLVCGNGKRDACCALRGRALLGDLGLAGADVWECTHLGGHRFAANLVCLPHGIVYGRVRLEDGRRLVDAYLDGRVDARLLRGRSAWPPPAQVAEQHVRIQSGVEGIGEVELVAADVEGVDARVTLAVGGTERTIALRAGPEEPPRPISCRADELEQPIHWRVVG